ncbi:unnamed protein product [Orchesella dallaii]|uniref:Uncharacterized protein n=1 Tax=Orchesella dallaii TaxID=48710 RepID=A0ABP1PVC6_9HEXA
MIHFASSISAWEHRDLKDLKQKRLEAIKATPWQELAKSAMYKNIMGPETGLELIAYFMAKNSYAWNLMLSRRHTSTTMYSSTVTVLMTFVIVFNVWVSVEGFRPLQNTEEARIIQRLKNGQSSAESNSIFQSFSAGNKDIGIGDGVFELPLAEISLQFSKRSNFENDDNNGGKTGDHGDCGMHVTKDYSNNLNRNDSMTQKLTRRLIQLIKRASADDKNADSDLEKGDGDAEMPITYIGNNENGIGKGDGDAEIPITDIWDVIYGRGHVTKVCSAYLNTPALMTRKVSGPIYQLMKPASADGKHTDSDLEKGDGEAESPITDIGTDGNTDGIGKGDGDAELPFVEISGVKFLLSLVERTSFPSSSTTECHGELRMEMKSCDEDLFSILRSIERQRCHQGGRIQTPLQRYMTVVVPLFY